MHKNKITLKIFLFLISTDFLETFTQFCFKKSALTQTGFFIKNFPGVFYFVKTMLFSGYLWIGFLSVFLTFVIWSTLLSKIDLSIAVPICSFSYILVPLTALFFLHEQISFLDWTGIFFILIGVIIVSRSTKPEEIIIP